MYPDKPVFTGNILSILLEQTIQHADGMMPSVGISCLNLEFKFTQPWGRRLSLRQISGNGLPGTTEVFQFLVLAYGSLPSEGSHLPPRFKLA